MIYCRVRFSRKKFIILLLKHRQKNRQTFDINETKNVSHFTLRCCCPTKPHPLLPTDSGFLLLSSNQSTLSTMSYEREEEKEVATSGVVRFWSHHTIFWLWTRLCFYSNNSFNRMRDIVSAFDILSADNFFLQLSDWYDLPQMCKNTECLFLKRV